MGSNDDEAFARVAHKIDPRNTLRRAREVTGGVSARVTALEVEQADGVVRTMIVRQHGVRDREGNPNIAGDEFALLRLLHARGLPVPAPYLFDRSGDIFATPYVVLEFVEGQANALPVDRDDALRQLAATLADIHRVDGADVGVSFLPDKEQWVTATLRASLAGRDGSPDERHVREALQANWPPPRRNRPVLLHGDYWPGNTIWRDGRLVAVIDWEDAAVGDPLADVANSRLEILWAFGIEAMHRFTDHYRSMTTIDFTNLPYWDLCAALRPASKLAEWAADDITEKTMREGHRLFITQAFEKLSVQCNNTFANHAAWNGASAKK